MTLMSWMQPCMAMQQDSSTTPVNPTATHEWSMWKAESISSSLLSGRSTEEKSSPMITNSPLKMPATNSTVTVGPGVVAVFSTETSLVQKRRGSCLLVSLKLRWHWIGLGEVVGSLHSGGISHYETDQEYLANIRWDENLHRKCIWKVSCLICVHMVLLRVMGSSSKAVNI